MREKFIVDNYQNYANKLQKLCDFIINHPLCNNHYEIDIQWAILDFLFGIAYNPVGALRKNLLKMSNNKNNDINNDDNFEYEYKDNHENNYEYEELLTELKKDFIPIEKKNNSDDDSDLSVS